MKLGAEKKGEVIALVVLLLVAAGLLWRSLATGPDAPAATVAVARAPVNVAQSVHLAETAGFAQVDPRLHMQELERLQAIRYSGNGRNLFRFGPAPPTPAQRAATARAEATRQEAVREVIPAGPPPPPPIPLRFYGFAQPDGGPEKIFLEMGNDNFVVSKGDVIEHRYQIENIGKVSVRVKDLQTQSEQELPLVRGPEGG